jgi:hypothetical protein
MAVIKLDQDQTYALLHRIVREEENEGFIYERPVPEGECRYVHFDLDDDGNRINERPGCLVGQILSRAGVPLSELELSEGRSAGVLPFFDAGAKNIMDLAQAVQDGGDTWGQALKEVDDFLKEEQESPQEPELVF